MSLFPSFLRHKSGSSELFILFVLASPHLVPNKYSSEDGGPDTLFFYKNIYPLLPELVACSDHINDVMSFYKECEDEADGFNYIASLAKVNQISRYEALDDLMNQMVTARKRVIAMAERSGSLELKTTVVQYFQGYISLHISWEERYRLTEVFGEDWYKGEYL
ncbi:hypothetical protein Mapa_013456 [Marchantia paleacea]|nr:hypothetical protein Mapa_013456 [Marchantia paleacea]